jgi:Gpi18-like mannosyltransferase
MQQDFSTSRGEPATAPHIGRVQVEYSRIDFNRYFLLALIANLFCLFLRQHADMWYWHGWAAHLDEKGFVGLDANYPPIYLYWLYLVGNTLSALHIPWDNGILLKTFNQLPVIAANFCLLAMVYDILRRYHASAAHFHLVMLLAAVNPALLFDGPLWGQVDAFPMAFVGVAFYLLLTRQYLYLVLPLYTLSLLTKFQMICFAPVFGIVFFRNIKQNLIGVGVSIACVVIVLLPMAIGGDLLALLHRSYVGTVGEFAYSTMYAPNLWMLVTGNLASNQTVLLPGFFNNLLTVKVVGILLYFIVCLYVFIGGIIRLARSSFADDQAFGDFIIMSAIISATGFFVFLPEMHERYIMPAVYVAVMYAALNKRFIAWAALVTAIALFNMTQLHTINYSAIWPGLSWLIIAFFIFMLLENSFPQFKKMATISLNRIIGLPRFPLLAVGVAALFMALFIYFLYAPHSVELRNNQQFLMDASAPKGLSADKRIEFDKNLMKRRLSVDGKKYLKGISMSSAGDFEFTLPNGATRFDAMVGVDDMIFKGEMQFAIYGDDTLLWESVVIATRHEVLAARGRVIAAEERVSVDVAGYKTLRLKTFSSNHNYTHLANWVEPVLTMNR